MQRRLTLTIVALVAGALVLAGVGTLLVTRQSARDQARQQLLSEAASVASEATAVPAALANARFRSVTGAADVQVVRLRPDGSLAPGSLNTLPAGIILADIQPAVQLSGAPVSGIKGGLAFAAAPVNTTEFSRALNRAVTVHYSIVVTRQLGNLGPSWAYFLLVGATALAIAAGVGYVLSRRIARPLRNAVDATGRIAGGDLSASVPVTAHDYPELASLGESINSMAASLDRSRRLERQFLLSVSHDLRTPLTSIRGFAEAIAEGAAPDTQRAAAIISSESKRLERLVQDLLELAKLDSKRFSLSIGRVDATEVIASTAEGFRPMLEKAGLALSLSVEGSIWVSADPDRLAQIVANLVENAFNHAAAAVTVSASHENGTASLTVEDDGPGMPAEDLDLVFQRMFQSVRTRTRARNAGSGLGLAIVAELAQAMGGRVRAESPVSATGGTRVVVGLRPWGAQAPGAPAGDVPRANPPADSLA